MLIGALAVIWAPRPVIRATRLLLPALGYVFVCVGSAFWANNPLSSVIEMAPLVAGLILFAIVTSSVDTAGFVSACSALAIGGGLVGIVGIAQYFDLAFTSIPSVGLPSATFGFRNVTASYLVVALPLATLGILRSESQGVFSLSLVCTLLMGTLLVFTRTRGAWIALAAACTIVVVVVAGARPLRDELTARLRSFTQPRRLAMAILVGLAAFVATRSENPSDAVIQRFDRQKTTALVALQSAFDEDSARGRLTFWENTLDLIRDHPILGVGLDNWEYAYPPYDRGTRITPTSEPARPHNDVLWIAAEIGLVGLCFYLWLLVSAGKKAWEVSRSIDPERALIGLACAASLTAFTVHGLFSFPKEQPATLLLFWTSLAGIGIAHKETPSRSTCLPRGLGALTVVVCLLVLATGWRHLRFDGPFSRALWAAQTGNWSLAIAESQTAIPLGAIDHRITFILGKALHENGQWAKAESAYVRALDDHPNYANTHHNLAGVYARRDDFTSALRHFETAHRLRPTDGGIQINHGNTLIRAGRFNAARAVLLPLVSHDLFAPQANAALGAVELYRQNPAAAVRHLERAITLNPNFNEARNNLAMAYEQSGRLNEAIDMYEIVLRAWQGDPDYAEQIRAHLQNLRKRVD